MQTEKLLAQLKATSRVTVKGDRIIEESVYQAILSLLEEKGGDVSDAVAIISKFNNVEWDANGDPLYSYEQVKQAVNTALQATTEQQQKDLLLKDMAELLKQSNDIIKSIMLEHINTEDARQVDLYHSYHFNNDVLARYNQLNTK